MGEHTNKMPLDGRTRYAKVQKLLEPIVGQTLHKNKLWRRIMIVIGSDERTIRDMMYLMINLGMIEEVKENYYKVHSCEANI